MTTAYKQYVPRVNSDTIVAALVGAAIVAIAFGLTNFFIATAKLLFGVTIAGGLYWWFSRPTDSE